MTAAHLRAPVTLRPMDPEPGEEVFFHGHPSWRSMLTFHMKGCWPRSAPA